MSATEAGANESAMPRLVERKENQDGITNLDVKRLLDAMTREKMEAVLLKFIDHEEVRTAIELCVKQAADPTKTKIFVRELAWHTTSEKLREVFAQYGEIIEAVVILKNDGSRSRGFGFVTFTSPAAAINALKEPSKMIDGRLTQSNLASVGNSFSSRPRGNGNGNGQAYTNAGSAPSNPNAAQVQGPISYSNVSGSYYVDNSGANHGGHAHHHGGSGNRGFNRDRNHGDQSRGHRHNNNYNNAASWEQQQQQQMSRLPMHNNNQKWISLPNFPSPNFAPYQSPQFSSAQNQNLLATLTGLQNLALNSNAAAASPKPAVTQPSAAAAPAPATETPSQ